MGGTIISASRTGTAFSPWDDAAPTAGRVRVGIVAVQGAFREHANVLADLGADPLEIRVPRDLDRIDALVLPGGETTAMQLLLTSSGLWDALGERLRAGTPTFGTCAGMILLAREIGDGRPDQRSFGVLDISVLRNGYGRQVDSFEIGLHIAGVDGGAFPGVFIRAPLVTATGAQVDVLATVDGHPVLVRQGPVLAAAFHPELSGDSRVHHLFLGGIQR